jgi:flagellar biosynthesis GTPase FlhF
MLVKKFEADNLEEALKAVKVELGPDAIILKTVTNNGIKGAFKKKRIEITAAISEKSYEKKAKVDKVLSTDQKEAFYQKPASVIKDSITRYNGQESSGSYGSVGLNKVVNTIARGSAGLSDITAKTSNLIKNSLDDFLTDNDDSGIDIDSTHEVSSKTKNSGRGKYAEPPAAGLEPINDSYHQTESKPVVKNSSREQSNNTQIHSHLIVNKEAYNELKMGLRTTQNKLELLEQKLMELSQNYKFNPKHLNEAKGIFQLRMTLKTLDVDECHILDLIKKANYELSKEDLENPDIIFEFALQKMAGSINTDIPLFAKIQNSQPVITILISEAASGQSTMGSKIAVLKKDVVFIQYSQEIQNSTVSDFANHVFGIKVEKLQNFSEVVGICRKSIDTNKSILIDLRLNSKYSDETKKFIETIRRGFNNVEVLCTLSAIHSELYNRKIMSRYKDIMDGIIISHVDLCMNFGAIFNVHLSQVGIPLKFFGTGPVVPDDIEGATAERLMAGLFQF